MAVIGPKYNGMSFDIVSPFQSADERDYERFRNANKSIQDGMLALGKGFGDARKYDERKRELDKLAANENEIARLERLIKDLDVQIANTTEAGTQARNANIGIKRSEIPSKNDVEGGPYPFSNDLDSNQPFLASQAEYYGRTLKDGYGDRGSNYIPYVEDPRRNIMPYEEDVELGPDNFGMEDHSGKNYGPNSYSFYSKMLNAGRKAGL